MESPMMPILRPTLFIMLALTVGVGCTDHVAVQTAQDRQKFDQAVAQVARAYSGLIAQKPAETQVFDPSAQQAEELAKAVAELDKVVTLGTPTQRLAAQRLLGQAHQALARDAQNQATRLWVTLSQDSRALFNLALVLVRAQNSADAMAVDSSKIVGDLNKWIEKANANAAELNAQLTQLQNDIQTLESRREAAVSSRDDFLKQAQAKHAQAFPLTGQPQFELTMQAIALETKAETAQVQRDQAEFEMSLKKAEQASTQRQLQAVQESTAVLTQRLKAAQDAQTNSAQQRQTVLANATDAGTVPTLTKAWNAKLEQVNKAYRQEVTAALDKAQKELTLAVAAYAQAESLASQAGPVERATLPLATLSATLGRGDVLANQLAITASLKVTLEGAAAVLKSAPELVALGDVCTPSIADLQKERVKLNEEAQSVLKDAGEKLAKLTAPQGTPLANVATEITSRMDNLKRAITPGQVERMQ